MGPGVVQLGYGTLDHRAPLIFDAESIAADDLANRARRHSILSRNLENMSKQCSFDRYNSAGAAFAEERVFRWRGLLWQFDRGAELRRYVLQSCRAAGFGQSNGDAAVAQVVRRAHRADYRQRYEAFLQALFRRQVDSGRLAGDEAGNRLGIFAGGELQIGRAHV